MRQAKSKINPLQMGFDFSQSLPPAPAPKPKRVEPVPEIDLSQPVSKAGLNQLGFINLTETGTIGLIDTMSYKKGLLMVMIYNFESGRKVSLLQRGKATEPRDNLTLKEVKELML